MNINYKDKLKTFIVGKNTELVIDLPENASAGYLWQQPVYDNSILELKDNKSTNTSDNVGAIGTRELVLITKNIGKTSLFVVLRRPWESISVDSFSISVQVI